MPDVIAKPSAMSAISAAFRQRMKPQGPFTAIEIDGETLRVVQTAGHGSIARIANARIELPAEGGTDAAALGRAIAAAIEKLGIKPGSVVLGVPRPMVVLRTLTLPPLSNPREMASMVQFQISKDLPFRFEDAVIDFTIHEETGPASEPAATDRVEVLAVAVKRDVVDYYTQVAAAARLRLAGLGWLSYANARVLRACGLGENGKPVALVSLRPDEVNLDVVVDGALLFSRVATIHIAPATTTAEAGSSDAAVVTATEATVPPGYVELAAIEAVRSLHSYGGMEPTRPVTAVVVTGATGHEEALVQNLQQRFPLPCSMLEPTRSLGLSSADREQAAGAMSAIGLALAANDDEGLPFDFLNPKRPPPPRNIKRTRALAVAAAITALLMATLGIRQHLINKRKAVYSALQAQVAREEKNRPTYRQMRVQAETIQQWMREGRTWLEHYVYLSSILPASEEIYITQISMSGTGSVRLAVQARSGDVLARLDKQLRAAGYDVKAFAINPGADRFGYDFRSTVELSVPGKMKIDLAAAHPKPRPADDASLMKKQ